jgi:hypothetical protein
MEYLLWILAILGFVAFCSIGGLTARIRKLEQQMGSMQGSPVHEEKLSLMKVMREYIGKKVELEFRGDECDLDLINVPVRKGSCIVEDVDKDWVRVHITYDRTDKVKLIRLQAISGVKGIGE